MAGKVCFVSLAWIGVEPGFIVHALFKRFFILSLRHPVYMVNIVFDHL
jgi:hypothetical protein